MSTLYLTTDELAGNSQQFSLSAILDFDHVVKIEPRVQADLFRIETQPDSAPYAPDILDPDTFSTEIDMYPDWELITSGLTGQYGIGNSPWLHNSELIEGGVAHRVLEHATETGGGFYVAVYAQHTNEDDPEDYDIEGWAIAYRAVSK